MLRKNISFIWPIALAILMSLMLAGSSIAATIAATSDFESNKPSIANYSAIPPNIAYGDDASVMILFDNSGSMGFGAYYETCRSCHANNAVNIPSGAWDCVDNGRQFVALPQSTAFNRTQKYYGYFDSYGYYTYNTAGSYFELQCTGGNCTDNTNYWSGNLLNYFLMNRMNVAKKVLTGGELEKDNAGNIRIVTETPAGSTDPKEYVFLVLETAPHPQAFKKESRGDVFVDDRTAQLDLNNKNHHLTPYHGNQLHLQANYGGTNAIEVYSLNRSPRVCREMWGVFGRNSSSKYDHVRNLDNIPQQIKIKVAKDDVHGVIQKTSGVRFGLSLFHHKIERNSGGSPVYLQLRQVWNGWRWVWRWVKTSQNTGVFSYIKGDGATVKSYVGSQTDDIVDNINSAIPLTATPLAESLSTIVGYFKQDTSWRYDGNHSYQVNNEWDPFYFNNKKKISQCSDGSVIIITDGAPTDDSRFLNPMRPAWLSADTDYYDDFDEYGYNSYLDNIALYAHTQDLRMDGALPGKQTLTLYPVYTFGQSAGLMKRVAINGSFKDDEAYGSSGNNIPNKKNPTISLANETAPYNPDNYEWDIIGTQNNDPKNFYQAVSGDQLQNALEETLNNIKAGSSKNASSSVISSSGGVGDAIGAIYLPAFEQKRMIDPIKKTNIYWLGNLRALFVDSSGNLRENNSDSATIQKDDGTTPTSPVLTIENQLDFATDHIVTTKWKPRTATSRGKLVVMRYTDINGNGIFDTNIASIDDEDANGNCALDAGEDKNGNGLLDTNEKVHCKIKTTDNNGNLVDDNSDIKYLWDAGEMLANLNANQVKTNRLYTAPEKKRYVFTYIDVNNDKMVTSEDEVFPFTTAELAKDGTDNKFGYFLGTNTNDINSKLTGTNTNTVAVSDANTTEDRNFYIEKDAAGNSAAIQNVDYKDLQYLIDYIRGDDGDNPDIRSRKLKNGRTWKLGDILQSSPLTVQNAAEHYDVLYNDASYRTFKQAMANRRTMVYVGGNDGMLHAFNGGFFQPSYVECNNADCTQMQVIPNKFWKSCAEIDNNWTLKCDDTVAQKNVSYTVVNNTLTPSATGTKTRVTHPLGKEMWAYVPYNMLPHLQWLLQKDYQHVYYVDLTPKAVDVKLWPEDDPAHPGGWGTILIGGMRFGGGPIMVNSEAKSAADDVDKIGNRQVVAGNNKYRIMKSSYFIFDITNPEKAPVLLDEFTLDTEDVVQGSFTTVSPYVIPVAQNVTAPVKDTHGNITTPGSWDGSLRWYLIMGNGPTNLDAESDQDGRVFVREIASRTRGEKTYQDFGSWMAGPDTTTNEKYFTTIGEKNSFMSDPFVADFQIGSPANHPGAFIADAIYFGSIAGKFGRKGTLIVKDNGTLSNKKYKTDWTGRLHRIVVDKPSGTNAVAKDPIGTKLNWNHGIVFDPNLPISTRPIVSPDENGHYFIFFGTGRFLSKRDKNDDSINIFAGLKEPSADTPTAASNSTAFYYNDQQDNGTVPTYAGSSHAKNYVEQWNGTSSISAIERNSTNKIWNVTAAEVTIASNGQNSTVSNIRKTTTRIIGNSSKTDNGTIFSTNFASFESSFDNKDVCGWFVNLGGTWKQDNNLWVSSRKGERNLTSAAVARGMLAFNAYTPVPNMCAAIGSGRLFATYAKTGTAYWKPIIGASEKDSTKSARTVYLGGGMPFAPSIYYGKNAVYIRQESSKGDDSEDIKNLEKDGSSERSDIDMSKTGDTVVLEAKLPFGGKAGEIFWKNISD